MTRSRRLQQLITKPWGRVPQRDTAEESASLTERIEFGDFRIDLDERTRDLGRSGTAADSRGIRCPRVLSSHPQSMVTPRTTLETRWTANRLRQTEFLTTLIS